MTSVSKKCSSCKELKALDLFSLAKGRKHGRHHVCKSCVSIRMQEYNAKPEVKLRHRNWILKTRYGISNEEYDRLLVSQDGRCKICSGLNKNQTFHVDHDHETGMIRGLLCNGCNTGIGLFRDNPEFLTKAALYLTESKNV